MYENRTCYLKIHSKTIVKNRYVNIIIMSINSIYKQIKKPGSINEPGM